MRYACAANSERDFRNYVARSVRQYGDRIQYYQVFNEPLDAGRQPPDRRVYVFKVKRGLLAIAWTRQQKPVRVPAASDVTVIDIMGNTLQDRAVELTATPVYFLTDTLTAEELKSVLLKRC